VSGRPARGVRPGTALAAVLLAVACAATAWAQEIPPKPARWFNDYARLVSPEAAQRLDAKLEQFEKATSNQVVVAIFPELPGSSPEDFAQQTFDAWGLGQKDKRNGVLLAVFVKDRRVRIHTGYGLEGALPDVVARRIIADEIAPEFRAGRPDVGLERAIDAIIAATKGEYQAEPPRRKEKKGAKPGMIMLILIIALAIWTHSRGGGGSSQSWGRTYGRRRGGYGGGWGGGFGGGSFGGFGGGGGGGGGWSGGGGGGFSGGGGSSGGGGASGSW
jgi:uncharacterized protein